MTPCSLQNQMVLKSRELCQPAFKSKEESLLNVVHREVKHTFSYIFSPSSLGLAQEALAEDPYDQNITQCSHSRAQATTSRVKF
jgi:hypothetical protein